MICPRYIFRLLPACNGRHISRLLPLPQAYGQFYSAATESLRISSLPLEDENKETDFNLRFQSCTKVHHVRALHALLVVAGRPKIFFSRLINLYAYFGAISCAHRIFNHSQEKDVYVWNSMVSAYCRNGRFNEAVDCFHQFFYTSGLRPDFYTFPPVLKACRHLIDGRKIHCSILKLGYEWDVFVAASLIHMYSRFGFIGAAKDIFDGMPVRDGASWNAMISGYCLNGNAAEALEVVDEMRIEGTNLDAVTVASVLSICAQLDDGLSGMLFHLYAIKYGLEFELFVSNALINMYAKFGSLEHANRVFYQMVKKDPRGYLVNDTVVVEAEVIVRKVLDYWSYDSKKETGYVGLKNQGATCYMNSLLQTLYHIPYFRKAVYHMPTTENDMPTGSIPLALQSLFYKLQYNDTSVATKELTRSFGWDTYDSFMQHDVQELNRVLCEKLEDKMKGTVVEGMIQQLFEGHHMNYIECINVDYKSTRKESFYDLQLDVKGCRDVYASFDKYVEVERLEGDNKYHAENHGLQDAKKGVLFIDFPPVLQLQLKRFEYDFMRDSMVKINDRYEFPLQLDLDRDNGKYLSPEADRSVRNLYTLHSVLVHSGGVHGGHYYAFIRPTLSDQWYKFDDERVTKEDVKRALEEQYGGEEELPQTNPGFNNTPFKFTKYSNAYMLVYIRESDKDKIICNVDEKDIAEHLRMRLKKEQEEKEDKRRYKAQAHLYTIIKVARDEDLKDQIGRDIYFDLVDHDKVSSFRVQKQTPFNVFKEDVAKEFGIPVQYQRFWIWAKRQNHTYRPNRPLTPQEETQSVGQLKEASNKTQNAELKLFLEVELGMDLRFIAPPEKTKEDILLFFKLYDPEKGELRYVGRLFVKSSGKPIEIVGKLNQMAGFAPDEEIELYEEIKFEPCVMCERLDKRTSFRMSQIEDGDIICFQKSPLESEEEYRYPELPSFLEYVHNRQIVHFRSLEKSKEDDFCLELSKSHTYDDVVEKVAEHIGLDDPTKIRLTTHNCYSQTPKPQPVKYRGVDHLSDMLVHYNQTTDILYYEVLDIPLPELQGLKNLKVAFHHANKDEAVIHNIRLPKQSTVGDVINELKTKVELSHPNAELRLLEVFYHKIYKIFPPSEKIENINDQYWTLRAEEIPEEEKNLGPHDRLIHVYHFTKESAQNQMQVQNFGEPFFLVIHEGETLAEVKVRIQKKLQVSDEEFAKWKFAFLSLGRPEYLQDSDVVFTRFQRRDVYGAWEQYLGLEHADNTPKRSYAVNQNRHTFEKPVKIYN